MLLAEGVALALGVPVSLALTLGVAVSLGELLFESVCERLCELVGADDGEPLRDGESDWLGEAEAEGVLVVVGLSDGVEL